MDTIKKAAPTREPQSITPDSNPTVLQSAIKRIVCILGLWSLITPKTATAILRWLGVSNA